MHAVLSAAPRYGPLAAREIREALPPGAALEDLAPGAWLASAPGRFGDLSAALGRAVFVRHLCRADAEVPLPSGEAAEAWVAGPLLRAVAPLLPPTEVQVQVDVLPGAPDLRPGPLCALIREALAGTRARVVGGPAGHALSIVVAAERAYAGCGPVEANRSPWPGGVARLRARPGEISRSARKLEEALELWGIRLPRGGSALDLGCAPGGWTGLLLDLGLSVTAVDTARLSPALQGRPALTFLQGSAGSIRVPAGPFDFLAADMSWDPLGAAAAACRFRRALRTDAAGVFTIKFFGGHPLQRIAATRAALEAGGFRVGAVRHLYHDRAEATALLRA